MRKLYVVGLVTIAFLLLPTVYASGDFTIVASPTILTIAAGNFGSSTITVTGSNGFSGTVLLSSSVSPNNPTITTSLN
ncbi:MAG TPA: hypothetical protein VFE96_04230, partial [Candidatus Bathyarchaeia archaeon]|nr:hypothetical protein [Candidatus Bathyarchaeia archaeon]